MFPKTHKVVWELNELSKENTYNVPGMALCVCCPCHSSLQGEGDTVIHIL